MTQAPLLSLHDFSQPFMLENNAREKGIGAILMQQGEPVVFLSKALSLKNQSLSKVELLAIVMAIIHWNHYLEGTKFHHSHWLAMHWTLVRAANLDILQAKGILKLLGLNYKIHYKKWITNRVVNALSFRDFQWRGELIMITFLIVPSWMQDIH